jgi:toxin FitB
MIILDTNVFSATMADRPDLRLTGWIDRQPWKSLYLTTITVYEVQYGIEVLAAGARRRRPRQRSNARDRWGFLGASCRSMRPPPMKPQS